jgi:uncharacterized protein (DUF2126 family)/transglutaminase-like putative cysteine protease
MSIHVALRHSTHYTYDRPVAHAPHVVRLRPAPHCRTRVLAYSQQVTGGEHFINWQQDPFSNWNARLVFPDPMRELRIDVDLVVEMSVLNPFDFFLEPDAFHFPFEYEPGLAKDLAPFLEPCPRTSRFAAYLEGVRRDILLHPESVEHAALAETGFAKHPHGGGELPFRERLRPPPTGVEPLRTIDFLVAINQRLQCDIEYVIRLEPGVQEPERTLELGSGSCRDSAWVLVQLLRHCGLAARFVSGYLIQLVPDVAALDGPSGPTADFTDLHAWCEVYLPGAGWVGLDPTSGLLAGEGHIPLSSTPEPTSAAPVTGAVDECESSLRHEMRISRIHESPRVTKPYSEEEWRQIEALGHAIDVDLEQRDVRLTMGGEPTFVSIDDPDGPEWNFTAASPAKRVLSGDLLKRLRRRFAPGSLLHYGQGKWYPGESLPRWALAAYWRKDGVPVWNDDSLIADESKDYGCGPAEAKALALRIAEVLGVDGRYLLAGYEDAFYYTWRERRLPSNVTPERSKLDDPEERERIARIFDKGLGSVVGFALPIRRALGDRASGWTTGPRFLRDDETLWLTPGDSPMGLRLPLDALPWVSEYEFPRLHPPDPMRRLPPLPREFPLRSPASGVPLQVPGKESPPAAPDELGRTGGPDGRAGAGDPRVERFPAEADPARRPALHESAPWVVRTALCVEPRHGRLYVFLPPVATTEDWLELVAGVETAVRSVGIPVIVEGETPPKDPRLEKLAVTPDPGVIEVNLHPSRNWGELVDRTLGLYDEARLTRLGTEKFLIDGRHTGTGGGNHIIIGGETPADSPVLRRPDLLRSLITYWQHHPSLSWLFSSLFIGPTSQAPRIDEARHDSLFELELAFAQMPSSGQSPPPWLVDRLLRNLLIDATGNTHRAEFCIDKLFAPDTASGRLGLVELRAFEMPPHARMSLAQHLLLRGLISKFWQEPYARGLIRWGTELHDRWMLPHYCEADFRDIVADLREAGYPFAFEWFAPHFEFRFPRIGEFVQRDIRVELRTALEPWHVLGEQQGPGGTVRYVDSSLERLQVKVQGMAGDRFVVSCNGRRLPLRPTGTNGESVAGVRYRAWQPPECFQPNIGVHTPLVFDLVDTWSQRSLGGCVYHAVHPGGRNWVAFPINAYEAESRRLSRFFTTGHTQGKMSPPIEPVNREFPYTLDLRNA